MNEPLPCSDPNCIDASRKHWHSNSPDFIFVEGEKAPWEADA
jgi:hypothetical protein